ncbi:hypothetical protein LSUB1_G005517 [Lachnellula subtilissima]|uniref:Uncharacterized protein n=1 Tax=Lachnellula subtilissima TaxID=602034 RepID=A0A8H8RG06_9HELO|nr:hypothetical protein LSUB1_G005517 [Lachnellula subtilissima]
MPPPPPVTPSPHRFVIKKDAPARKTPLAQEYKPRPSQFNTTPRFTVSSTPRPTATQSYASATPSVSRYLTPGKSAQKEHETIDILSSDGLTRDIQDSLETEEQDHELEYLSDEDDYALEEPGPKRRRLSSSPAQLEEEDHSDHEPQLSNSSLQILSSPPAPRRAITTAASRFLTPAPPSTPAASYPTLSTFRRPPPFRPPDPSEQAPSQKDPLPDHFSPQKGGRKYIPGGLAAELQGWLVNIESALPSNVNREDPWLVKIVVDEVSGGARTGMTMIRGRQVKAEDGMIERETEMKIILAGEGAMVGLQRGSRVEVGKTVGVKGPVWEVLLEGEKWGVGVDWKVLPD